MSDKSLSAVSHLQVEHFPLCTNRSKDATTVSATNSRMKHTVEHPSIIATCQPFSGVLLPCHDSEAATDHVGFMHKVKGDRSYAFPQVGS